jgi:PAS domain S-box-containing protein
MPHSIRESAHPPHPSGDLVHSVASWREEIERAGGAFRAAFNDAAIGMAIVDLNGRFLHVNQSLCGIVGYSQESLLQTDFQSITHPDDLEADLTLVRQLLADEIPSYHLEKRYFHKTGRLFIRRAVWSGSC